MDFQLAGVLFLSSGELLKTEMYLAVVVADGPKMNYTVAYFLVFRYEYLQTSLGKVSLFVSGCKRPAVLLDLTEEIAYCLTVVVYNLHKPADLCLSSHSPPKELLIGRMKLNIVCHAIQRSFRRHIWVLCSGIARCCTRRDEVLRTK